MTELEIMRHAKGYLDKLAEGVDPLTGESAGAGDLVRKERIAKCLRYVSGVLDQLIAQGGLPAQTDPSAFPSERPSPAYASAAEYAAAQSAPRQPAAPKRQLPPFAISPEALRAFQVSPAPLTMTEFTRRVSDLVDPETVEPLKPGSILEFLEAQGYLQLLNAIGKRGTRRPTTAGLQLGISLEDRQGQQGSYTVVVYNETAQAWLLAHMEEIVARNTAKYQERRDAVALQGTPWTREQDDRLRELCRQGLSLGEIARRMQRSSSGIHYRLQHLGLELQQGQ